MKSIQLDYGDFVVHITSENISLMSSKMALAEQNVPVKIEDKDFFWEIIFQDAIEYATETLYNDFTMSTDYEMPFNVFAKLLSRARIAHTVLIN